MDLSDSDGQDSSDQETPSRRRRKTRSATRVVNRTPSRADSPPPSPRMTRSKTRKSSRREASKSRKTPASSSTALRKTSRSHIRPRNNTNRQTTPSNSISIFEDGFDPENTPSVPRKRLVTVDLRNETILRNYRNSQPLSLSITPAPSEGQRDELDNEQDDQLCTIEQIDTKPEHIMNLGNILFFPRMSELDVSRPACDFGMPRTDIDAQLRKDVIEVTDEVTGFTQDFYVCLETIAQASIIVHQIYSTSVTETELYGVKGRKLCLTTCIKDFQSFLELIYPQDTYYPITRDNLDIAFKLGFKLQCRRLHAMCANVLTSGGFLSPNKLHVMMCTLTDSDMKREGDLKDDLLFKGLCYHASLVMDRNTLDGFVERFKGTNFYSVIAVTVYREKSIRLEKDHQQPSSRPNMGLPFLMRPDNYNRI